MKNLSKKLQLTLGIAQNISPAAIRAHSGAGRPQRQKHLRMWKSLVADANDFYFLDRVKVVLGHHGGQGKEKEGESILTR